MKISQLSQLALFALALGPVLAKTHAQLLPQQPAPIADPGILAPPQPVHTVEDWSQPALDPNSVGPISSAVLGTSEKPEFTRELVRVQWRAADPLDLFVILPHGVKNPPVILYLYGYPADAGHFWDDAWCKRATADGFAAVGFVSALTGDRYQNRPMKTWFVSELKESLGTTTHDVQMIISYLLQRHDVSALQVGFFGQGSGGTIGLLAASVDRRIVAVDALDPWGDWPDWLKSSPTVPDAERAAYRTPQFLSGVAYLDPVHVLPSLKTKAVRVEQSLYEGSTPPAAKAAMAAAVPSAGDLVQYKDEPEHLKAYHQDGLTGWLRKALCAQGVCPATPL